MYCCSPRASLAMIAALVLPNAFTGCGSADVTDLAASAKSAVSEGVNQVSESTTGAADRVKQTVVHAAQEAKAELNQRPRPAGQMAITLDGPLAPEACYVDLIRFQSGRPDILQFRSYRDPRSETFPSVFVRAELPSGAADNLAGQTIAAQMFVQAEANGPVWFTSAEPVQLKIQSSDARQLSAELAGGSLANAATGAAQPVSGNFTGNLP